MSVETPQEFHYQHSDEIDFTAAAAFTRRFAQIVLSGELPPDVDILKIEVPSDAIPETPWRLVRISRQRYYVPLPSGRRDLGDQKGIDYTRAINWDTLETDSDVRALVMDRVVSVSPLSVDLTARVDLDELAADLQRRDEHE